MNTNLDRLPPNSPEVERALLGCVLLDPATQVSEAVSRGIVLDDFYDLRHRQVFETILGMVDRGEPVNLITLNQQLKDDGRLDGIGGIAYLSELQDASPSAVNLPYYAEIVKEQSSKRRAIRICTELVSAIYESNEKIDALLDHVESQILSIRQVAKTGEVRSMKELVRDVLANIEARLEGTRGVPTGFKDIDRVTNGGIPDGNYWVVAARPNEGKTALAMNIVEKVAEKLTGDECVLVFSLEMSAEDLAERMLAGAARVNTRKAERDSENHDKLKMNDADLAKLAGATGRVARYQVVIDDTAPLTIGQIRARARRLYAKRKVKLIVVDYLQLIASEAGAKESDRRVQVDGISRGLKALAKELRVPVIAVAQLNRDLEHDKNRKPRLSDLREAGGIEQDADLVGFLYSTQEEKEKDPTLSRGIKFRIGKQRNGPKNIDIPLTFFPEYTRFENAVNNPQRPS